VRRRSVIAPLLTALVLLLLITTGMSRLVSHADRDWSVATEVTALRGGVRHLNALKWEAIAKAGAGDAVAGEAAATLERARRRMRWLRAHSDAPVLRTTERALREYDAAIRQEFALLLIGRPELAERVGERRVDPAFRRVHAASIRAVARHRAAARDATSRARVGSIVIAVGGMALVLGVALRFERARRAVSSARAGERAQNEREQWLRSLLRNASDTVAVTDASGRVVWMSEAVEQLLGVPAAHFRGRSLLDVVEDREAAARALDGFADRPGARDEMHVRLRGAGGRLVEVEARVTNLLLDPIVAGIVVNMRDVGERKALEERLRHQAMHDPLTGLANRALFEDRLTRALLTHRRDGGRLAVLFCDIDDFKTINDSLGHEAGDEMLVVIGRRLASCLREADSVARLGGDEFAVLLHDAGDAEDAAEVARRVLEAINVPIELAGRELTVHGSVGIALTHGEQDTDAQALLREADVAMYAAKSEGKGRFRLFEPQMHEVVLDRLELKADLSRALDRGELALAYQPIVDVDSSRVAGVEALLRWSHPARGDIRPDVFIPLAEETGLIVPIGRWVVGEATARLAEWKRRRPDRAPGHVSVNVAGPQLHDPDFARDVAAALERSGIAPDELILEVTETSLIEDTVASSACFAQLRELGVRLAIDDFGSGYSALNYLRRFPMDILKIDRSFVQGVAHMSHDAALTRAMIAMAGALGLAVVAEGVEETDQLSELQALECGMAQGFLFSRAVGPDELLDLLDGKALGSAV
jgi:diguanylate cyclase (GGDEF)-like protein/PAS domain S-box-containing protein